MLHKCNWLCAAGALEAVFRPAALRGGLVSSGVRHRCGRARGNRCLSGNLSAFTSRQLEAESGLATWPPSKLVQPLAVTLAKTLALHQQNLVDLDVSLTRRPSLLGLDALDREHRHQRHPWGEADAPVRQRLAKKDQIGCDRSKAGLDPWRDGKPLTRLELVTSPLPRECSTAELQGHVEGGPGWI